MSTIVLLRREPTFWSGYQGEITRRIEVDLCYQDPGWIWPSPSSFSVYAGEMLCDQYQKYLKYFLELGPYKDKLGLQRSFSSVCWLSPNRRTVLAEGQWAWQGELMTLEIFSDLYDPMKSRFLEQLWLLPAAAPLSGNPSPSYLAAAPARHCAGMQQAARSHSTAPRLFCKPSSKV